MNWSVLLSVRPTMLFLTFASLKGSSGACVSSFCPPCGLQCLCILLGAFCPACQKTKGHELVNSLKRTLSTVLNIPFLQQSCWLPLGEETIDSNCMVPSQIDRYVHSNHDSRPSFEAHRTSWVFKGTTRISSETVGCQGKIQRNQHEAILCSPVSSFRTPPPPPPRKGLVA